MRAMMALVVGMGVLIVAGVAVVAVTIVGRMGAQTAKITVTLNEPAGTHIAGVAALGDHMAVVLQGGGPDRIVVVQAGEVRLAK